jgi:hypothetical protein
MVGSLLRNRLLAGGALLLLVVADVWGLLTVWNAVTGAEGEGAIFWTAVLVVAALLAACIWLTLRIARRLTSNP